MNTAHRSVLPQQRRSRRPTVNSMVTQSKVTPSSAVTSMPSRTAAQNIEKLNVSQRPKPVWFSSLRIVQRSSDLMAFLLVATTLSIYSWTVYTQQQWSKEYRKLEDLQHQERQLTTTNAVMKNQLAQQAEQGGSGLRPPTPSDSVVLPSALPRPVPTTLPQIADPEPTKTSPLGY
jgi:hypothetical protein